MIDICVSIRILKKSCRYLRHPLQKTQTVIVCVFFCYQEDKRMLSWKQKAFGIVEMFFAG